MMGWIRIVVDIRDDPKIEALADALKIQEAHALGLVVGTLVKLPAHAITGDVSRITDKTLEKWAGWHGKVGLFAGAFRDLFCTAGVVTSWQKHNGAPIRKAESNADYKRQQREIEEIRKREADAAKSKSRSDPDPIQSDAGSASGGANETGRDGTGLVAVPCDSKKLLTVSPPRRSPRGPSTGLTKIRQLLPAERLA